MLGGGVSGLAAAKDILAANKSFLVLEARDRVGGRIFDTHFSDGYIAQLGGQFVGETQDRVIALGTELGVEFVRYTQRATAFCITAVSSPKLAPGSIPVL